MTFHVLLLEPTALPKPDDKIYDKVLVPYMNVTGCKKFQHLIILSILYGFWYHDPSTLIYTFSGRFSIMSGYLQENED